MSFLSSIAVVAATRLGYKLAEKKKWLPTSLYHHLTLIRLRDGNLRDAHRFNQIVLHRKPHYEKALIVQDVISMQRDALLAQLIQDISHENTSIREIVAADKTISRQLDRLKFFAHVFKFLPWIFLFFNIFLYLSAYYVLIISKKSLAGGLLSAGAGGCTVLILLFFRSISELHIQNSIKQKELSTAQKSRVQELNIHQHRLRELQSQLSQTRHYLRTLNHAEISQKF